MTIPTARLSRQATSSSSELENSETAFGATVLSARDLARTDLELRLNLVRSETRPTSEAGGVVTWRICG